MQIQVIDRTRSRKVARVQHSGLAEFTAMMVKAERARSRQTRITRDGFAITW